MTERIPVEVRLVPQHGVTLDGVWFPVSLLSRLSDQDVWDSEFGGAFIEADRDQERVLLAYGLAIKETRGGLHRAPSLADFMSRLQFTAEETS